MAFGVLVDRYQKRAFWVAFHVLGASRRPATSVQEAFVRVFRSLDRSTSTRASTPGSTASR
jgi:DNA-directed RNA polymerase specialized sigma24 family protein